MKIIRNIARRPWPRIGGWLPVMMLICGVLASCSSEDESTAPLPDGKYPLQLTAEVAQPQTRAGGKDAWTGGEEIRVSLEGVFGNKTYVMDASGNASPKDADNAFYWKNTDEARVSAWTPDIESETDISDQSGGYAAFDVLYASAIGRYDQAINLRFIHRMAKIEVILKAGEGITEEELEGATVTIFGDPLTHSTAGLVSPGDQSDGEIKPYYDAATKKYEALVPPQDMTGKPLIRISIGSNDFTYTPETEAAGKFGFFGGKRYAYTITVKASGIEVTAAKGGTWNAGGSENVGVTITYDGTETEPKIGDYYYSDGTWSDGGLRKLYADGTMEWAETKPQPENGKNVIAIVFHAGHHENDASDYSATGIGQQKCHGYAVALQDATNGYCQWGVYGTELGCCPTDGSGKKQNNYSAPDIDWSGYAWTQKIITAAGGKDKLNATEDSGYPATYYAVVDYAHKVPSPANSTGWFLPSIGQMWNVYQNRASLFEGKTVVSGLKSDWYWSSSEFYNLPAYYALYVNVNGGFVYYYYKYFRSSYVRPVLAF